MTDKEIKKIREKIPQFINGVPCKLTPEQKQLHKELDCRDMINSCLCYGTDFLSSHYSKSYIKELGKEKVVELFNEQKADFDKGIVLHNVGEDSEGNSYNSIIWADESKDLKNEEKTDDEEEDEL